LRRELAVLLRCDEHPGVQRGEHERNLRVRNPSPGFVDDSAQDFGLAAPGRYLVLERITGMHGAAAALRESRRCNDQTDAQRDAHRPDRTHKNPGTKKKRPAACRCKRLDLDVTSNLQRALFERTTFVIGNEAQGACIAESSVMSALVAVSSNTLDGGGACRRGRRLGLPPAGERR